MSKTLLVFRYELRRIILRRSFLLVLFLLPLASVIIFLTVSYIREKDAAGQAAGSGGGSQAVVEGYVDQSGLIQGLPDQAIGVLQQYDTISMARAALADGEISAFYVVPPDYLKTGQVIYYRPDFNPLSGITQSNEFQYTLTYNLAQQDPALAERINRPLAYLTREVQTGQPQRNSNSMLTFFLPYGVTFLFYFVIFSAASLMLNSITDEKQNRVIEILMTSVTPMQLLTGKIIALGIIGLLQTVVYSGTGFLLLRQSRQTFQVPDAFQLPPTILVWGVIFFLLGYAVYASLMAAVGALVPNLREASQATMIIILPLILPLMMISLLANQPEGAVSIALSLFPLTAPVAMMARLAAGAVPIWQLLLSVVLLVITALLVLRSAAGIFRAQNLLSGQAFNVKLFFHSLLGRA